MKLVSAFTITLGLFFSAVAIGWAGAYVALSVPAYYLGLTIDQVVAGSYLMEVQALLFATLAILYQFVMAVQSMTFMDTLKDLMRRRALALMLQLGAIFMLVAYNRFGWLSTHISHIDPPLPFTYDNAIRSILRALLAYALMYTMIAREYGIAKDKEKVDKALIGTIISFMIGLGCFNVGMLLYLHS